MQGQLLHIDPSIVPTVFLSEIHFLPGIGPGGQWVKVTILYEGEELFNGRHVERVGPQKHDRQRHAFEAIDCFL